VLMILASGACQAPFEASGNDLPPASIEISREGKLLSTFKVELALTLPDQGKGLMNRKSLPKDQGMAFLFSTPVRQSFHMFNTPIALDIAFWDEDNEIIDVMTMTPCTAQPCPSYLPASEFIGALEVNAGVLESKRIRPGDTVALKE
jgi:uncharacterized membrane protein (UPF0127 family)